MIKTFIFDLGKVIVPFELDNSVKILESFCDITGVEIREKIFASEEIRQFETGKISAKDFFEHLLILLNAKIRYDHFVEAWNSIFSLEPLISENLIKNLASKYRLLILSDTNELHFEFIRKNFPILSHFDEFVVSFEVGFLKPAPEMFRAAVEKAQCLPNECLFTDDREGNVKGAKKFGIDAVQFISSAQFEMELERRKLL
jgi:putative hydrolase of the HAD superfamily